MRAIQFQVVVEDHLVQAATDRLRNMLEREFFGSDAVNSKTEVKRDGYFYPFMNDVVRANPGYGDDYEPALKYVKDWSVAIDGGSQIGRVANQFAEKFKTVHAVEIAKENYDCLVKNAKPNVVCHHACLGNGEMPVSYIPDKDSDSPVYCANGFGNVPMLHIDNLNLEGCGFIKLDIQGYEYYALDAARKTLEKFKPVLFLEHDPGCFERYGLNGGEIATLLYSLGYELKHAQDGNQTWV